MSIVAMTSLASRDTTVIDRLRPRRRGRTRGGAVQESLAPAVLYATELITTYIPTEVVTTYVAIAALLNDPETSSRTGQWIAFWIFLALTPLCVWLLYGGWARARGFTLPWRPVDWPHFELVAATVSYVLWGFSLPGTPFGEFGWYRASTGAIALLVGSTLLGLVAPLFRSRGPATGSSTDSLR